MAVMFCDPAPKSPMRLIDFGSGCLDRTEPEGALVANGATDEPVMHTTFAGSAFYISPEMFQRSYTQKTDVWSAGAFLFGGDARNLCRLRPVSHPPDNIFLDSAILQV